MKVGFINKQKNKKIEKNKKIPAINNAGVFTAFSFCFVHQKKNCSQSNCSTSYHTSVIKWFSCQKDLIPDQFLLSDHADCQTNAWLYFITFNLDVCPQYQMQCTGKETMLHLGHLAFQLCCYVS